MMTFARDINNIYYLRYVSAFACLTIYLLYRNLESNQIVFHVSFLCFGLMS